MGMSGQFYIPTALSLGKNPGTNWIEGWVGPRASLDTVTKRKIPFVALAGN
jgi:hypothetical protein